MRPTNGDQRHRRGRMKRVKVFTIRWRIGNRKLVGVVQEQN